MAEVSNTPSRPHDTLPVNRMRADGYYGWARARYRIPARWQGLRRGGGYGRLSATYRLLNWEVRRLFMPRLG